MHLDSTPKMGARLGALKTGSFVQFRVWAPYADAVEVELLGEPSRRVELRRRERGYHEAQVGDVEVGDRYFFCINGGKLLPDPASRHQPEGVHGASAVVAPNYPWSDGAWSGVSLQDLVIYELHVGTYTHEGTFDAVMAHLPALKKLGITALELMPVAQFPGARNWGYDGVYPFAVQNSYGGPEGMQRLVDAAHASGIGVILDVVYNHLGPEGNYLSQFGPYFTDRYRTPWGSAINFDGPGSSEVREFFFQNALQWKEDFHLDGLRLDAVHSIFDHSAYPFLEELNDRLKGTARGSTRPFNLIVESDLNDPRLIQPKALGGYGLDAQWNDDFHHALHVQLSQERAGYYRDFSGLPHLAKSFRAGYIYTGEYSEFRQRRHGRDPVQVRPEQFVVYSQNHDQVGNRRLGERLGEITTFLDLKLAASCVILSPFTPLLFMGEEFGTTTPFQYFTDHSDDDLIGKVREGRAKEFADFGWESDVPDPQGEETFRRSKLDHTIATSGSHQVLKEFYTALLSLRKLLLPLPVSAWNSVKVQATEGAGTLLVHYDHAERAACVLFCFDAAATSHPIAWPAGRWDKKLDSADRKWGGEGSEFPDTLIAEGEISVLVTPKTTVVYQLVR